MKKFAKTLVCILLSMSFLISCTDNSNNKDIQNYNEIYLASATKEHPYPDKDSFYFYFNYIYNGRDIFDSNLLNVVITYTDINGIEYHDRCSTLINGISHDYTENVLITPYSSITIIVNFDWYDSVIEIAQCKSVTITYIRLNEVDRNQDYETLNSKIFQITDLISRATHLGRRGS